MDIKAKIDEVVAKVQSDPTIASDFQSNPVAAVEKILSLAVLNKSVPLLPSTAAPMLKLMLSKSTSAALAQKDLFPLKRRQTLL